MEAHSDRTHAKLAPSAASRWMNCPGSIQLEATVPETGGSSAYAEEGTAAHELATACLIDANFATEYLGRTFNGVEVDEEMVEAVDIYINYVWSVQYGEVGGDDNHLDIEQRIDLTHVHPEMYGTGDAIVFEVDKGLLHVIDFKYGVRGVVNPEENPQLLTYAVGAMRRLHNQFKVEMVRLTIVQPRAYHERGPIRSWDVDPVSLLEFEMELTDAAERTEDPGAPRKAGEWCLYCRAQPICPEARERAFDLARAEFNEVGDVKLEPVDGMSADRRAQVLRAARELNTWLRSVESYAHERAEAGDLPTGYKLVAKRATRRYRDEEEVEAYLRKKRVPVKIWALKPKLKSPAQLEKALDKPLMEAIEKEYVVKKSTGTNLVPESDKRTAIAPATASAEFDEVV